MVNTFDWNNGVWDSLPMHILYYAFDAPMDLSREQANKQILQSNEQCYHWEDTTHHLLHKWLLTVYSYLHYMPVLYITILLDIITINPVWAFQALAPCETADKIF